MNAFLLSIGDELVSGMTVNTNSAWLAERLGRLGIRVMAHVTVGDDVQAIAAAIRTAWEQLEGAIDPGERGVREFGAVLLVSGGLGPTDDDLTRQGLADALNQRLVEDPDAMLQVARFFEKIGRPMAASNRLQALRPQEAGILENPAGTAPGLRVRKEGVEIFVMPGVPREMREMFERGVVPVIEAGRGAAGGVVTEVAKINTFGLGESNLGERIKDLMVRGGIGEGGVEVMVGTTVHDGIVSVRIYATGERELVRTETERVRQVVMGRLGALVFGEGEVGLEMVVGGLLKEQGKTVATAESCTGGLLAMLLTEMAGASGYFGRGWVTYANGAKEEELGVSGEMLRQFGAVSEEVCRGMAEGARRVAGADYGLSVTGVAGPEGGSAEKPVGTVWIGLASAEETVARRFVFPGARGQVRLRAAQMGLALLRWRLMGVAVPV